MAESFEAPDETERLQINLEDDVRAFLISRLAGNQLTEEKKRDLREMGIDIRRLCKPSYIMVHSGSDAPPNQDPERCHIGAEGVMIHEDEEMVHLAFKCGDADHKMHYTTYDPGTVLQMALGMEAVWPGSIIGAIIQQAVQLGRMQPMPPALLEAIVGKSEDEEEDEDEDDETLDGDEGFEPDDDEDEDGGFFI